MNQSTPNTKDKIIEETTELILKKGYSGFSITDIMTATGLQKGGIYNHFSSKKEIALLALGQIFEKIKIFFSQKVQAEKSGLENLIAFIETFYSLNNQQHFLGEYPFAFMNDSKEVEVAKQYLKMFSIPENMLKEILTKGVQDKVFRQNGSIEELSTYIISSIHGSMMLYKTTGKTNYLETTKRKVIQFCTKELL